MAKIKVRARTVDMLGRQQIAGIPTAISELFKNAHDAYASNVVVDFYEYDDLFVLRDDGLGMTRDEFESNWLTLGTESKFIESSSVKQPLSDPSQEVRTILGEKGIGRLAVAALGTQVLVLTRAKQIQGKRRSRNLVAAYLNWDIFSLPQIDLNDIEIPIREFKGNLIPTVKDIKSMVAESSRNLKKISEKNDSQIINSILQAMESFDIDPEACSAFLPEGPTLSGLYGHGTHFYIRPADSNIKDDIDLDSDANASALVKMLIGFTNTMTSSPQKASLIAEFRRHSEEGAVEELIGPSEFFSIKEAENADHHFIGTFDEYGRFKGKIRLYNQKPVAYESIWNNPERKKTQCGPFTVNLAYMQGTVSESMLPADEFALIGAKLNKIGGLYIYRDGIRILPYGNSNYDFLNIEQRRNKGAGYYFFSYRRIFGAIELSRKKNLGLIEKAGREGFRENYAYREFKSILENFFIQLAADYFRKGGENTEIYESLKSDLVHKEVMRREREKKSKAKREKLAHQLDSFFYDLEHDKLQSAIIELIESVDSEVEKCKNKRKGRREEAARLLKDSRESLLQLKSSFRVTKPQGVGLPKKLTNELEVYQVEWERLENECFTPTEREIEQKISKTLGIDDTPSNQSEIILIGLEGKADEIKEKTTQITTVINEELSSFSSRVKHQSQSHMKIISDILSNVLNEASEIEDKTLTNSEIEKLQVKWDNNLRETVDSEIDNLNALVSNIHSFLLPHVPSQDELTEALEEELVELRDSQASQFELLQLGMALGVIHHEFRGCVRALREALKKLKRWADTNPKLSKLHRELRTNFDHLDGYLTLFTPLTRRLNRSRIEIKGWEIEQYLDDLFSNRFEQHLIKLKSSDSFKKHQLFEYPSSIYPCFVNLVDNSCFWLKDKRGERTISLDLDGDDICVSDTGPGIPKRDSKRIFELGFTRKPAGQGMGLHVCKETLRRIGYEIILDPPQRGKGAKFRIRHMDNN